LQIVKKPGSPYWRARLSAWDDGHREARRWFVSSAQGYEVGVVKPKELVDAVSAYFKSRFSHLSAIHDHNVAVARLEHASGVALADEGTWAQSCQIADE